MFAQWIEVAGEIGREVDRLQSISSDTWRNRHANAADQIGGKTSRRRVTSRVTQIRLSEERDAMRKPAIIPSKR